MRTMSWFLVSFPGERESPQRPDDVTVPVLSTLESSASHPRLSDPGCPLPWLVIAQSGCLCAVGDTAAHVEQVGAPGSAQLAARAKPVVSGHGQVFQGQKGS